MTTHLSRLILLTFLTSLLLAPQVVSAADGDAPKEKSAAAAAANLVEVRFANGSIVVMALLQESLEIQTEYGKLTVPNKDIRLIEFGIHMSDADRRKVEDAIALLGHESYQQRETAVQDLVVLGPLAYIRLQTLATSKEPEVAGRAEMALKRIREKFPAKLLRAREEDVVRTAKFTIAGTITTPVLKAHADDFGDLQLRPDRLFSIRWLPAETTRDITIDAATYAAVDGKKWLDTGIRIDAHMGLKITASGQVDLMPQQPGQNMTGPDGLAAAAMGGGMRFNVIGAGHGLAAAGIAAGGELVGRIGTDGAPFIIGAKYAKSPHESGKLYLQIVPSPMGGNSTGEYRVTVVTGPFPADEDIGE